MECECLAKYNKESSGKKKRKMLKKKGKLAEKEAAKGAAEIRSTVSFASETALTREKV